MAEAFIGEIRMWPGNFAPYGWLLCQGQTLSISQYQALFSLIGVKYGGDGSTTFQLPDLSGRVPVHKGQLKETFHPVGEAGGAEMVALTEQQLPAHSHLPRGYASGDCPTPGGNIWGDSTAKQFIEAGMANATMASNALKEAGKTPADAHKNMIPYLAINFIICWDGIYPTRS